jgi:hypothetical protein
MLGKSKKGYFDEVNRELSIRGYCANLEALFTVRDLLTYYLIKEKDLEKLEYFAVQNLIEGIDKIDKLEPNNQTRYELLMAQFDSVNEKYRKAKDLKLFEVNQRRKKNDR